MILETIPFASGTETEVYPTVWVSYEDAFYPLWVRAYQPETFSHKRRSPKFLRNDNLGFGVISTELRDALFKVNAVVSNA